MKIDFSQQPKALAGDTFKNEKNESLTLSDVCIEGLNRPHPVEDQRLTGEQKFKRWDLSRRIYKATEVEVSAEEIADLKKCIGLHFPPSIVGPCFEMLEAK